MRRLLLSLALLALTAPAAVAHKGDPNYLSVVNGMPEGVEVSVINRDDRLLVVNKSGREVVIEGYSEEPYLRLTGDGTVQVNTNSEAYYLNEDRFGQAKAPEGLSSKSEPKWKTVTRSGRYEFHDHRMHWMAERKPEAVTDESKKTKVFDWKVPVRVGEQPAFIEGTLFWTPKPGGGLSGGAIAGLAALVLMSAAVAVIVRRRRGREPGQAREEAEAW